MTVRQFIEADLRSGDFTLEEKMALKSSLKYPNYQRLLDTKFTDYSQAEDLYKLVI